MSESLGFLIDAPMQSWGVSSKFQRRNTEGWPTKSGLVGLIAAAMGVDKHESEEFKSIHAISSLIFSVFRYSKSHPSIRLSDFHTIGGGYPDTLEGRMSIPPVAERTQSGGMKWKSPEKRTVVTNRTYLTDARFIAVFQGERATLERISAALLDPVWGVWFGRKTCIPAMPLSPVLADTPREAIAKLLQQLGEDPAVADQLEGLTESDGPGTWYQSDQPIAFGRHHGPVPEAYQSRSVRRLAPGEMP